MSASVSREPMSNIRLRPPGLGPCQSVSCSRFERQAVPSMSDTPRRYGLDDLKGDVFGGVVSAVMMVPVALGFGVLSGLGPVAAFYGAIAVGSSPRCSAAPRR